MTGVLGDNSKESSRMDDDVNGGLGMSGLLLPNSMKLKGSDNYLQWKQVLIRNIIAAGLIKYLRSDLSNPTIDITNWQSAKQTELDNVSDWMKGNTKTSNTILYNCHAGPQAIITNCATAAEMWDALEQAYEGTGIVVQHQELINFITMKYEDFNNLSNFITSFKNTIQRLSQVMDSGETIPSYWPAMLFVYALQIRFPIWAERQRCRQREKDVKQRPSLDDLIADIQDEARRIDQEGMKSDTTKALHLNQREKEHRTDHKCDSCQSKNHSTRNCLHNNPEKRKAWEESQI